MIRDLRKCSHSQATCSHGENSKICSLLHMYKYHSLKNNKPASSFSRTKHLGETRICHPRIYKIIQQGLGKWLSVMCLPCEHEDQSSSPQNSVSLKNRDMVLHACNSRVGKTDRWIPGLTGQAAGPTCPVPTHGDIEDKNGWTASEERQLRLFFAFLMHKRIHRYTYIYMNTHVYIHRRSLH